MDGMKPFADVFPAENIRHHFIGGVYAKELHIPRGAILGSHAHRYDHMSVLVSGYVSLEIDGETRSYQAPHVFNIPAGKKHMLRAISDAVWLCVHATDIADPAMVDETLIIPEPV